MLIGLKGKQYQIVPKPFSSGGEGDIYCVAGQEEIVIKLYHADRRTPELEAKITQMSRNPPSESVLTQVAWPLDVVYDGGAFAGFVMPKLHITTELGKVYEYPQKTNITLQQKLILAENICVVIHAVHEAGYIFGDFNPRNIGVDLKTGRVAFLDTDTYHIVLDRKANRAYRCSVCAPGYCAPELLKKCADHIAAHPEDQAQAYAATPLDTFTQQTDNFALAIHMFRLLMNGFSPYGGIKESESASVGSPGVGDAAVKRDSYSFKKGNKPQSSAVPPMSIHPKAVQKLFERAFIDGRDHPEKRPSAYEWHQALEAYEKELIPCQSKPEHFYRKGLKACPWCEADEAYQKSIAPRPSMRQRSFSMPVTPQTPPAAAAPVSAYQRNAAYPQTGASPYPGMSSGQAGSGITGTQRGQTSGQSDALFRTAALIAYLIGWIAFFGSAGYLLHPIVSGGSLQLSLYTLMHTDMDRAMLITGGGVLLVTAGTALRKKHTRLACRAAAVWGFIVCTAWTMIKTGFINNLRSVPSDFFSKWILSLLGLAFLIYFGSQLGTGWRNAYFRRIFTRPRIGAGETALTAAGLAVTAAFIWLLGDLSLYYRLLSAYTYSAAVLAAVPVILYLLMKRGKNYGKGLAVRSLACTVILTFFTCALLWIMTQTGLMQDGMKIVMTAGVLIIIFLLHAFVGGGLTGITGIGIVAETALIVSPGFLNLPIQEIRLGSRLFALEALPPAALWCFALLALLYELVRRK